MVPTSQLRNWGLQTCGGHRGGSGGGFGPARWKRSRGEQAGAEGGQGAPASWTRRASEGSWGGCGPGGSVPDVHRDRCHTGPGLLARTNHDVHHLPLGSPAQAPTQTVSSRACAWSPPPQGPAQHVPWSPHCQDGTSAPMPPQGTRAGGHRTSAGPSPHSGRVHLRETPLRVGWGPATPPPGRVLRRRLGSGHSGHGPSPELGGASGRHGEPPRRTRCRRGRELPMSLPA